VDDFDAVGGGIEIKARIGVGFLAEDVEAELPPDFFRTEEVFGELSMAGNGGDDDDPVGDDGRIFLGEGPDGLGEDGGRKTGAGDEDGAGRAGARGEAGSGGNLGLGFEAGSGREWHGRENLRRE
jgi:hypothetical protein